MRTQELFALRAFIARGEARLSTMHAIAGAFISGAGLLILVPLFFRGTINPVFHLLLDEIDNGVITKSWELLYAFWVIPIVCIFGLPIYSLYLLIEELVILYFVPQTSSEKYFLPRFALTPLSMPLDDPDRASTQGLDDFPISDIKKQIIAKIYQSDISIAVPFDQNSADRRNLAKVGRKFSDLVSSLRERKEARSRHGADDQTNVAWAYDVRAGKTGLEDRSLVEEAARLEVSLVRLNARLRVMAIRYFKSLLVLIWTLIILTILVSFLSYLQEHPPSLSKYRRLGEILCLAFGLLWACVTPIIVNFPLRWIRKFGDRNILFARHRDIDLSHFELIVFLCCLISFLSSAVGLLYGIVILDLQGVLEFVVWGASLVVMGLTIYSLISAVVRLRR
jgi:hypothetical protein